MQTADGKHTTAAGNRGPLVYGFGDEPAEGTKVPDADDDDDDRRVPVTRAQYALPACFFSSVHSTKDDCMPRVASLAPILACVFASLVTLCSWHYLSFRR